MFAAIGLMACPNLAVSAQVMSHVVDVESGANPYAIGVVGGQLERQPKNLAEALATVHMLDAKGYNYSLGVAQVNRANLGKYGLDSYEKAFDTCPNLAAGAQILAACYASSGGNWGKAFSCYYSGDFVTGYRDGYVQKVYDSINRDRVIGVGASQAIPLKAASAVVASGAGNAPTRDSPDYRVSIRSVSFYTTAASAVPMDSSSIRGSTPLPGVSQAEAEPAAALSTTSAMASVPSPAPASTASNNGDVAASIFVPQVTGPNDPPPVMPTGPATSSQMASATTSNSHTPPAQEQSDAAFVF